MPMEPALLAKFRHFGPTQLDQVPNKPGLYAWYAKPQIGAADWARAIANDQDVGESAFRNLLAKHTSRFAPPSLRVNAHNAFRDTWDGRLASSTYERHVQAINKKDISERESEALMYPKRSMEKVLASERQRGRMSQLLTSIATPLLTSPVYIGKSGDLRRRVNDHFVDLDKWHRVIQRDSSYRERIKEVLFSGDRTYDIPDNFATRAIACGFSLDNLEIYILDIGEALCVNDQLALELAEALEWFLNTWHRPILGRA